MKKKIIVIISCIVLIAVSFLNIVKISADSNPFDITDPIQFASYTDTITSGITTEHPYTFTITILDYYYSNEKVVIVRIETQDEYLGDYATNDVLVFADRSNWNYNNYEASIKDFTEYTDYSDYCIYEDLEDLTQNNDVVEVGWRITIDCSRGKSFYISYNYTNYENDNEIELDLTNVNLGYSPDYYRNIYNKYFAKATESFSNGYDNGYGTAVEETLQDITATSFMGTIFDGIENIFQTQLFGGISIGLLIFIPLALTILFGILKIFKR